MDKNLLKTGKAKDGKPVSLDTMRRELAQNKKFSGGGDLTQYSDPPSTKIADWKWRDLKDVAADINMKAIPDYIQKNYGDFMRKQLSKAKSGDMTARDFLKAYGITQSSIGRMGLSYDTATKTGMKLPRQDVVRPEGAFSEWLGSKRGQNFLKAAEKGEVDEKSIQDLKEKFSPFSMTGALSDKLKWAIEHSKDNPDLASKFATMPIDQYRDLMMGIKGIGPAKSGFIGSLLGRGDLPTLDARQVLLHTGKYNKDPEFARRTRGVVKGKPVAGTEAVDRLIARQDAMGMDIDPSLEPFRQHLTHHAVWDKAGNSQTTHGDVVNAMKNYDQGGKVEDKPSLPLVAEEEYRGSHEAPGPHYGAPLHDVSSNGMYPSDFYGPNGRRYYANEGWEFDNDAYNKVRHFKDKPNGMVSVHRAIPTSVHTEALKKDAPLKHMIRKGDWVAINKEYAKAHGDSVLGKINKDYKIASMRVPAKHVWTNADSIHEWGYYPEDHDINKAKGGEVLPHHQRDANLAEFLKDSAIKDRLYHGTNDDFRKFSDKRLGQNTDSNASSEGYAQTARVGHWFNTKPMGQSPKKYGAGYKVDMPVYLSIKNPKREMSLDWLAQGLESKKGRAYRQELEKQGYDGVVLPDEEFGGESWVAFRPEQIKSAIGNRGTYDTTNPDITKAKGGAVEEPKSTVKAYKLFRVHQNHPGKLFPLFVNSQNPVEKDKWVDAKVGEMAGNKVKSKIGPLAYRPGWHAGDLPIATHIGEKSNPNVTAPDRRPNNQVWAEVEMPNDVDWQSEANKRGTNKHGRLISVNAHITDQIPKGGHYRYKTNPNMTGNWLIGGSMKVNRVLSDKEVERINKKADVADLPRSKPINLKDYGFHDGGEVESLADGGLYSPTDKAVEAIPRTKGTGQEFMTELSKRPGYKQSEVADRGLNAIANMPKMSKEQFMGEVKNRPSPKIEEKIRSNNDGKSYEVAQRSDPYGHNFYHVIDNDNNYVPRLHFYDREMAEEAAKEMNGDDRTHHGQHVIPGGENYREHLYIYHPRNEKEEGRQKKINELTEKLRNAKTFEEQYPISKERQKLLYETHYPDPEPYQSGHWDEPNVLAHARTSDRMTPEGKKLLHIEEIQSDWHQEGRHGGYKDSDVEKSKYKVPDAPHKKTWEEMVTKRLIKHAADNGYHGVALTSGQDQADRYDLAKHISEVHYSGSNLKAYDHNGQVAISQTGVAPDDLQGYLGKELSNKLLSQPKNGTLQSLSGLDMQVGGEGMKAAYDKRIPNHLNSIGKQFGAKVNLHALPVNKTPDEKTALHVMEFPKGMAEHIKKHGLPEYTKGGEVDYKANIKTIPNSSVGYLHHTAIKPNPEVGNRYKTEDLGGLADINQVDPESLRDSAIGNAFWDNSGSHRITGISNKDLLNPVDLEAGQNFARKYENIQEGRGGASGMGVLRGQQKRIDRAHAHNIGTGGTGDVYTAISTMAPKGVYFSHQPIEVQLDLLAQSGLHPKQYDYLDEKVRKLKGMQDFVGFRHPTLWEHITHGDRYPVKSVGKVRKAMSKVLSSKEAQQMLDYNEEDLINSVTDPDLLGVPAGYSGRIILKGHPTKIKGPSPFMTSNHQSYAGGHRQDFVGGSALAPSELWTPDSYEQAQAKLLNKKPALEKHPSLRSMILNSLAWTKEPHGYQKVNDRVINNIKRFQEAVQQGGITDPNNLEEVLKFFQTNYGHKKNPKGYADGGDIRTGSQNSSIVNKSLSQMKMELQQKSNPTNLSNMGVNETLDMNPKVFIPPDKNMPGTIPPGGVARPNGVPIGGVDVDQQQQGQQLAPSAPPGQPGQPPQVPTGPQGGPQSAPSAGGMPGGVPPPQGNMLSMTPQGQTLGAMAPQAGAPPGAPPAQPNPTPPTSLSGLMGKARGGGIKVPVYMHSNPDTMRLEMLMTKKVK